MKVASYFSLENSDFNLFTLWIKTLPININPKQIDYLWKRADGRKSVLWRTRGGFKFFD